MKCRELGQKYGVSAQQVGVRRKEFFPDTEGGELTDEELEVLTEYYERLDDIDTRKEMEEAVQPRFVEGFVTYVKPNTKFVECKIRDGDSVKTVRALIPTSSDPVRILFKPIKLEVITYNDKNYYRHASLANIAWPREYLN